MLDESRISKLVPINKNRGYIQSGTNDESYNEIMEIVFSKVKARFDNLNKLRLKN